MLIEDLCVISLGLQIRPWCFFVFAGLIVFRRRLPAYKGHLIFQHLLHFSMMIFLSHRRLHTQTQHSKGRLYCNIATPCWGQQSVHLGPGTNWGQQSVYMGPGTHNIMIHLWV